MLDILKGLWGRNNNNQEEMATLAIETASLHRLKQEYDQEVLMKVFQDPDYNALQETIYEKEKNVLQILNALDILYKAKETLTKSIQEKIKEESPFPQQKQYEEYMDLITLGRPGPQGYYGSSGTIGPIGTFLGSTGSGYYPTNPQFTTYTNNHIPLWQPKKNP